MPRSSDPAEAVSLMFLSQSRSLGESEARTARHPAIAPGIMGCTRQATGGGEIGTFVSIYFY